MLLLFNQCKLLSSLDGLENWETKNVLYMKGIFSECSILTSLKGISNWQTQNVKDMSYMFSDSSLKSLGEISD